MGMGILICLLNLVIDAVIALFIVWAVSYILSFFGFPMLSFPPNPENRFVTLILFAIGLILFINFLICAFGGGHPPIPPFYTGGYLH